MIGILEVQVDYNLKSLSEKTIVLQRVYFINNSKGTILLIKGILATPPKATPPRNKGLIRPY